MNRNQQLRWLARCYAAHLRNYLARGREASLEAAYELGRAANAAGLGVLDMARVHLEARENFLRADSGGKNRARISRLAGAFFLQTLSPFEATHRGFRETNAELQKRNRELAAEIRERRRTEKALRASEQRFSTLIETAQDVIFSLKPDGRIESLNRAFETITGWPREAWLGRSFIGLLHPENTAEAVAHFESVMRGEPPDRWEYRVRKANGEYAIGEFTKTREMRDGRCVGVFGIARDTTERKRMEESLRDLSS
jgi:PAS domain S-box-containing protein